MKQDLYGNMGEDASRIAYLVAGYVKGSLTTTEHQELDDWVNLNDDNLLLFEKLTDPETLDEQITWMQGIDTNSALARTKLKLSQTQLQLPTGDLERKKPVLLKFLPHVAAAIIVVFAGVWAMRYYLKPLGEPSITATADIAPGKFKAQLRLANEQVISIDGSEGVPTIAAGIVVNKGEGELQYGTGGGAGDSSVNTLVVPKGGMYKVKLSDGTRVWVNAGSSIEYPVEFGKGERQITLHGEAYFEVTKDEQRPFIVHSGSSNIKVLGTRFNINAYGDVNPIVTTVTEGRVALQNGANELVLNAKEAGSLLADGKLVKQRVDEDEAMAWTEGKFILRDATITDVMQQIARWYDATIVYETTPADHFNLEIKRDEKVSKVLGLLELTGRVRFEVRGREIVVRRGG